MPPKRTNSAKPSKSKTPTAGEPRKSNGSEGDGDDPNQESDGAVSDLEEETTGVNKILAKLSGLEANLHEVRIDLKEGLHTADFNAKNLSDKIGAVVKKTEETGEKVRETVEVTTGLTTRTAVHGLRLNELENRIEMLERDKRRCLIVVEGVAEVANKPSPEIIEELLLDLKIDLDTQACDRIYRRGREPRAPDQDKQEVADKHGRRNGREIKPRPIVVGFKSFEDKKQVYKHLKNLKGVERWNKVYINDDLTECQLNQQRDLRSLVAYARSLGREAGIRSNQIWVEGRKYVYTELHKLAPELTLEKAKTITCLDGKGVAFQGPHSPLSNLYPCNVIYKGKAFLSSEGALQYRKAVTCKKFAEAHSIEFERRAFEAKRVGGSFRHTQEWEDIEEDEILEILIVKFTDNPYCKRALLNTGDKKLFEATGDRVWACGLPLARIHELTDPPPGNNRTGKALEKVRGLLKGK